jgi:hypothetical protein
MKLPRLIMIFAKRTLAFLALTLGGGIVTTQTAVARSADGISASRANPVIEGVGPLESPNTSNSKGYSSAVFFDFAANPFSATQLKDGETVELVSQTQRGIALFQYSPSSRLWLEATVPYCFQIEIDRQKETFSTANSQQGSLGDVNFSSRIRILSKSSLSVALLPFATLPTGNPETLTGDGVGAYGSYLSLGGQRSRWQWAVQAGLIYRPKDAVMTDDRIGPMQLGSQYSAGLGLGYKIGTTSFLEGGIVAAIPESTSPEYDMTRFGESSIKIKNGFRSGISIDLQAAFGMGYGVGVSEFRVSAGLIWQPWTASDRVVVRQRRGSIASAGSWYAARPEDFAADQDVRRHANRVRTYDAEGEKQKSFGFYSP